MHLSNCIWKLPKWPLWLQSRAGMSSTSPSSVLVGRQHPTHHPPNTQGMGTWLEPSGHLLQVKRVPELPGPAQELLCKSSVVLGKNIPLTGIGNAAPQQLILLSSPTLQLRVRTDQWTACFIFPLTNSPSKGKRSVTS